MIVQVTFEDLGDQTKVALTQSPLHDILQVSIDGRLGGFDVERYSKMADIGDLLNTDDPNLSGFARRNGKLILWHGWAGAAKGSASSTC